MYRIYIPSYYDSKYAGKILDIEFKKDNNLSKYIYTIINENELNNFKYINYYSDENDEKKYLCFDMNTNNTIKFFISDNYEKVLFWNGELTKSFIDEMLYNNSYFRELDENKEILNDDEDEGFYPLLNYMSYIYDNKKYCLIKTQNDYKKTVNILDKSFLFKLKIYNDEDLYNDYEFEIYRRSRLDSDNILSFEQNGKYFSVDDLKPKFVNEIKKISYLSIKDFKKILKIYINKCKVIINVENIFIDNNEDKKYLIVMDLYNMSYCARLDHGLLLFDKKVYEKLSEDYLFDKITIIKIINYLSLRLNYNGFFKFYGLDNSTNDEFEYNYEKISLLVNDLEYNLKRLEDIENENKEYQEKINKYFKILKNTFENNSLIKRLSIDKENNNEEIINDGTICNEILKCYDINNQYDYDKPESNLSYYAHYYNKYYNIDKKYIDKLFVLLENEKTENIKILFAGCGNLLEIYEFLNMVNMKFVNKIIEIVLLDRLIWPVNFSNDLISKFDNDHSNIIKFSFKKCNFYDELIDNNLYMDFDALYFSRCVNPVDIDFYDKPRWSFDDDESIITIDKIHNDYIRKILMIANKYNKSYIAMSQVISYKAEETTWNFNINLAKEFIKGHENSVEIYDDIGNIITSKFNISNNNDIKNVIDKSYLNHYLYLIKKTNY